MTAETAGASKSSVNKPRRFEVCYQAEEIAVVATNSTLTSGRRSGLVNTYECFTINVVAALRTSCTMREHEYGWRTVPCQRVQDVVQPQFGSQSALATARDKTQRLAQRSFINEDDFLAEKRNCHARSSIKRMRD